MKQPRSLQLGFFQQAAPLYDVRTLYAAIAPVELYPAWLRALCLRARVPVPASTDETQPFLVSQETLRTLVIHATLLAGWHDFQGCMLYLRLKETPYD